MDGNAVIRHITCLPQVEHSNLAASHVDKDYFHLLAVDWICRRDTESLFPMRVCMAEILV